MSALFLRKSALLYATISTTPEHHLFIENQKFRVLTARISSGRQMVFPTVYVWTFA